MEKEQKLLLIEAEVNYDGCYYQGDMPDASCTIREVTLLEAAKTMKEESTIDCHGLLKLIVPVKTQRGKGHWIEKELEKLGYFHSSRVKSFKPKN